MKSYICVLAVCLVVSEIVQPAWSVEGERKPREERGKKAHLVRKLMKRRPKEGNIRLVDGTNEHEGSSKSTTIFHVSQACFRLRMSFGSSSNLKKMIGSQQIAIPMYSYAIRCSKCSVHKYFQTYFQLQEASHFPVLEICRIFLFNSCKFLVEHQFSLNSVRGSV